MTKNLSKKTPAKAAIPALSFDPVAVRGAVLTHSGAEDVMWQALATLAQKDDTAARDCIVEARMIHVLKLSNTDADLAKVRAILAMPGYKEDKDGAAVLTDKEGKARRSETAERAYGNARQYASWWLKKVGVKRDGIGSGGARPGNGAKTKDKDAQAPAKDAQAPAKALPKVEHVKDGTAFMLQACNLAAELDKFAHENAKVSPPKVLVLIAKFKKELDALAAM